MRAQLVVGVGLVHLRVLQVDGLVGVLHLFVTVRLRSLLGSYVITNV